MQVDTNSYTRFVLKYIDNRSLEDGRRVNQHMIDSRFDPGIILSNHLINMYAKCGSVENARQVFERMLERNLVSWNIMIAGYSKNGYYEEAMDLFGLMHRTGVKPREFTLAIILGVCVNLGVVNRGRELHAHIAKTGFQSDFYVGCSLVTMYAKSRIVDHACKVFDEMATVSSTLWNSMIAACVKNEIDLQALEIFS